MELWHARWISKKYAQFKGVQRNAVQMEFVYTENVCVDRITADNRAVNYQQWAMGQKQACFCHKTTTTAWSEATWRFLGIAKSVRSKNVQNALPLNAWFASTSHCRETADAFEFISDFSIFLDLESLFIKQVLCLRKVGLKLELHESKGIISKDGHIRIWWAWIFWKICSRSNLGEQWLAWEDYDSVRVTMRDRQCWRVLRRRRFYIRFSKEPCLRGQCRV